MFLILMFAFSTGSRTQYSFGFGGCEGLFCIGWIMSGGMNQMKH